MRILVVDDHPVFRLGMTALLNSIDFATVVGEAATADEAVRAAQSLQPDIVIMDLNLEGSSGVEATKRIIDSCRATRVLVLTMQTDDEALLASIRAGARGYLVKGAGQAEIERALHAVAAGEVIVGADVASHALGALRRGPRPQSPFPSLTERELEVLDLMAEGLDNPAIARRLVVNEKTVRNYVSMVLTKLQAPDRTTAILRARDTGLGVGRLGEGPDRS